MTVATTHYNEIKKYALSTEGVENASMEFDVETLSPTYRLSIGIPGKSNAFEISKKLGLPDALIDRAARLIERGDIEFEDIISRIEEDRKRAETERDEAIAINTAMKEKQRELDRKLADIEKKKKEKIIADAREEARAMIREAKRNCRRSAEGTEKSLPEWRAWVQETDSLTRAERSFGKKEEKYAEKNRAEV